MNKKKILFDIIFNMIATIIPIGVLQLIIFPGIANSLGNTLYGKIVTLVSLFTLFSSSFGNVLNNIRLLQNREYERENVQGDFNILLLISLVINTFIMILGTIYYEGTVSILSILLIIIISSLNLLNEYLVVEFRITLKFKAVLVSNILQAIGYILGFSLFLVSGYWQLIYILGYLFNLFYIIRKTSLIKERFVKTPLFISTTYKSLILFSSGFMRSALTYADKLLLYPLLGAEAVSVYYSATIVGKIISMGITPINGVLLSHLAKIEKIKVKNFIYIGLSTGVIGIAGYFICILINKPILSLLYPSLVEESMKLIKVTTAYSIFEAMSSVINPLILRFNNVNWQLVISSTNLVIYSICALIFFNLYGLIGFCIGLLAASIFKLILMLIIFVVNFNKEQ